MKKAELSQNPYSLTVMPSISARSLVIFGRGKTYGKHDQIEVLVLDLGPVEPVPEPDRAGLFILPNYGDFAPDEPDARRVFRSFVISFETLAVSADVIVEEHALPSRDRVPCDRSTCLIAYMQQTDEQ